MTLLSPSQLRRLSESAQTKRERAAYILATRERSVKR
jgi:hypothetical protein